MNELMYEKEEGMESHSTILGMHIAQLASIIFRYTLYYS